MGRKSQKLECGGNQEIVLAKTLLECVRYLAQVSWNKRGNCLAPVFEEFGGFRSGCVQEFERYHWDVVSCSPWLRAPPDGLSQTHSVWWGPRQLQAAGWGKAPSLHCSCTNPRIQCSSPVTGCVPISDRITMNSRQGELIDGLGPRVDSNT